MEVALLPISAYEIINARVFISEYVYRVTSYLVNFVHGDFGGRSPDGSFGDKGVGINSRTTCICKL